MARKTNRREFLKKTSTVGLGFWVTGCISQRPVPRRTSPHEKLHLACIGVGGRGGLTIHQFKTEKIVALCDVDSKRAATAFNEFAHISKFRDYRRLFDKMHKQIDAVTISTPDHMHAPITLAAMELGKHVYCEKPLTHTVAEARRVTQAAAKYKLATQMGNQGNSHPGARRTVEVLRSGVIGPIREIHAWTDRPIWPQGIDRPLDTPPVPKTLDWNRWLGVAPYRPYNPAYVPFAWRGWWDFGCGAMGDMACHICNVGFWALDLRDPVAVECKVSGIHKETGPLWSMITWEYPETDKHPALKYHWYDGGKKPSRDLVDGLEIPAHGSLFIGDKGRLYAPDPDGAKYTLLPADKFADWPPLPESIPNSIGHQAEWMEAAKAGRQDKHFMSHFERAGVMTEALLIGNLSVRLGQRIEWDAKNRKVTTLPEANAFIDPPYREDW